jgi:DNA invertase Pin-like site-specific DNA recombinase
MIIGYARTSTLDQTAGLDAQLRDLQAAGCERTFSEQVSSVDVARRDQLEAAIDYLRDGDTLVVTRLDRLARSVAHLLDITARIEAKGAYLRIVAMGIDTATATGRLMLTVLGAVGEFERSVMLERQREGVAKAKAAGLYKGRAPTARAKADEVRRLLAEGHSKVDVADRLGISRSSVHRITAGKE